MKSFKLGLVLVLILVAPLSNCCNETSLPDSLNNLYSSDASLRNEAALQLARCGALADEAVPKLSELLYDNNVGVQSSAAYALQKIDTKSARLAYQDAIDRREIKR